MKKNQAKAEEEEWKDIPGYESYYQVSSLGNVRSFKKRNSKKLRTEPKLLKHGLSNGYYYVGLKKDGKRKHFKVHQLVAIAFLNHIPDGMKIVVDHINGNKLDNRVENLQLISNRENCIRSIDKTKTSSKYIGVSWSKKKKKWRARIQFEGKQKNLGGYDTELKAWFRIKKFKRKHNLIETIKN